MVPPTKRASNDTTWSQPDRGWQDGAGDDQCGTRISVVRAHPLSCCGWRDRMHLRIVSLWEMTFHPVQSDPVREAVLRRSQPFSITLPNETARIVKDKVSSGEQASESEVIRDGLRAPGGARAAGPLSWLRTEGPAADWKPTRLGRSAWIRFVNTWSASASRLRGDPWRSRHPGSTSP